MQPNVSTRKRSKEFVPSVVTMGLTSHKLSNPTHDEVRSSSRLRLRGIPSTDRLHERKVQCVVYDEMGKDVTPLPLERRALLDTRKTPSILLSQMETTPIDFQSVSDKNRTKIMLSYIPSSLSFESLIEEDEFGMPIISTNITGLLTGTHLGEGDQPDIAPRDAHPDMLFTVKLQETETIILFNEEALLVQIGTEEGDAVEQQNDIYKKLCIKKETSDAYTGRWAQTFNYAPKLKSIQTVPVGMQDKGLMTNDWRIYDTYRELALAEPEEAVESESEISLSDADSMGLGKSSESLTAEIRSNSTTQAGGDVSSVQGTQQTGTSIASMGVSKVSGTTHEHETLTAVASISRALPVFVKSENMKRTLFIVERMLSLNLFQQQLAMYRGLPVLEKIMEYEPVETAVEEMEFVEYGSDLSDDYRSDIDLGEKRRKSDVKSQLTQTPVMAPPPLVSLPKGPYGLVHLWTFVLPVVYDYDVNCIIWNSENPDILAVGYGSLSFLTAKHGYAACWSLKNLLYPERLYKTVFGVSTLSFSKFNPALLAVAVQDGTILIYNIQNAGDQVVFDTVNAIEHQIGTVWQMMWVQRSHGNRTGAKREVLVSICEDGRVTQWTIRKGIESILLMRVKRTPGQGEKTKEWKQANSLVARYAVPFSLDFHPEKDNLYIIGTSEGLIHECSFSHGDLYLLTYTGHMAPVYRVAFNPFAHDIFVSCSGDWSMKIWYHEQTSCLLTLTSLQSSVVDVVWSPRSSTILACIHPKAIEIWDLAVSVLDPVTVYNPETENLFTVISFSPSGECILVGESTGAVKMYHLTELPPPPENQKEALMELLEAGIHSHREVVEEDADEA